MSSHLPVPSQLGRYRLTRLLGRGGMGAVYLATDSALGRDVALKIPHFNNTDSPGALERFEREARMAARLLHPNLCPVFDVGCIDGVPYFTMPFLEGKPLSEAMPEGQPWPLERAARLIAQLAAALQVLHSHGIIHRDLKPGNVLVHNDREPILMDFGLARSYLHASQRVTQSGVLVGTPAYMSPEQILGESATLGPATDIYSLGVLLYQMIAGRLPFEGPVVALFGQVLHKDPQPPSSYRTDGDTSLDAICLKAMGRDPQQRFADMTEFQATLQAYVTRSLPALAVPPLEPPPAPAPATDAVSDPTPELSFVTHSVAVPTARWLKPVLAAGAAVLLLAIVGAAWLLEQPPTATGMQAAPSSSEPERSTRTPPVVTEQRSPIRIGTAWHEEVGRGKVGGPWVSFSNPLGIDFVRIPADGVTVKTPLWMSRHEITVGQFRQFRQATGRRTVAEVLGSKGVKVGAGWVEYYPNNFPSGKFQLDTHTTYHWDKVGWHQSEQHPVFNITWNEAVAFCDWLGQQDNRHYELPLESEWEYACRAGAQTLYSWGNELVNPQTGKPGANVADRRLHNEKWLETSLSRPQCASEDDGHPFTAPVGSYPYSPNPWGLCDMHGNVAEFCADKIEGEYVCRGGSFVSKPANATATARSLISPEVVRYVGIRVIWREK